MSVTIRYREADIKRVVEKLSRGLGKVIDKILEEAGRLLAEIMRMKAPVRTGFLRESIAVRRTAKTVDVKPTAPYAPFVEYGTKPHIIRPVHAKALRFEVGGETIFARLVHHPGFPGRFFIRSAREESLPKIRSMAEQLIARELA